MARITRLANDKSEIVRITDRGITKREASIELCKETAPDSKATPAHAERLRSFTSKSFC
jgi:rare lipoprotein A (peptidoglycan hydrolase)